MFLTYDVLGWFVSVIVAVSGLIHLLFTSKVKLGLNVAMPLSVLRLWLCCYKCFVVVPCTPCARLWILYNVPDW